MFQIKYKVANKDNKEKKTVKLKHVFEKQKNIYIYFFISSWCDHTNQTRAHVYAQPRHVHRSEVFLASTPCFQGDLLVIDFLYLVWQQRLTSWKQTQGSTEWHDVRCIYVSTHVSRTLCGHIFAQLFLWGHFVGWTEGQLRLKARPSFRLLSNITAVIILSNVCNIWKLVQSWILHGPHVWSTEKNWQG